MPLSFFSIINSKLEERSKVLDHGLLWCFGVVFSLINTAFVSRQDTSGCSSVSFLRIYTTLVRKTRYQFQCSCIITKNKYRIRLKTRFQWLFSCIILTNRCYTSIKTRCQYQMISRFYKFISRKITWQLRTTYILK